MVEIRCFWKRKENFNYSCNLWAFSINKNIKAQFSHHFNHCADHVSCCFVRHRFGLSESGFLYFGIIVGCFCHLFCCSFTFPSQKMKIFNINQVDNEVTIEVIESSTNIDEWWWTRWNWIDTYGNFIAMKYTSQWDMRLLQWFARRI